MINGVMIFHGNCCLQKSYLLFLQMNNSLSMRNLLATSHRLVDSVDVSIHRYLYDLINWDDRLIMIKGARGVGKTTMLLQHIKETFGHSEKALYASCDNLWSVSYTHLPFSFRRF